MILEKSRYTKHHKHHVGDIVYVEQGVREVRVQIYRQKDRDIRWEWVRLDAEPLTEYDIPHKYKLEDFIPNVATNATNVIQRNDIFSDACNTLQRLYSQYVQENEVFDPRSRVYGDAIIVGLSDDYDRGDYQGTSAMLVNIRTGEVFYVTDAGLKSLITRKKVDKAKVVFTYEGKETSLDIDLSNDDEEDYD